MRTIADAIIKELHDTNADLDTIKAYVRVAMATAKALGEEITIEDGTEIVRMCCEGIPFNPLA